MKTILIINTGGTFNKVYNPLTGDLEIETTGKAIESIAKHWLRALKVINIIGKDSLDMTINDREEIKQTILQHPYEHVIVVHGTDTMNKTAQYLFDAKLNKTVILTGSMVPYSIKPIEAVANLASAYGYAQSLDNNGIFIAMNGAIGLYENVCKNRGKGYFEFVKKDEVQQHII
ncbi:MAG TPA: asparaginase [Campylobacterales bacterium]|nr:asparaginase [Campylobacterales bacterium]HIP41826.1 asparaginase [Campylobacterales bacterium]